MISVSIAMAVYNGEKYLNIQLDSIITQLLPNDELIISYDYSTDQTYAIISEYAAEDLRIKVLENTGKGVVSNFENALVHCSKDIILFSDQDDIWIESKIEKIRDAFLEPAVTVVIHDAILIDPIGNVLCNSTFSKRGGSTSIVKNLLRLSYIGCSMAFRSKLIPIILPIPTKERSHDWWTGTICSLFGKMVLIDEPLILHRIHEANATPKKRPGLKYHLEVRWLIVSNALIRCWRNRRLFWKVKKGISIETQL